MDLCIVLIALYDSIILINQKKKQNIRGTTQDYKSQSSTAFAGTRCTVYTNVALDSVVENTFILQQKDNGDDSDDDGHMEIRLGL